MTLRKKDKNKNPGDGWEAVNEQNPCPICGKPDNCKVSLDGRRCYCGRDVSGQKMNAGGQSLHKLDGKKNNRSR